MEKNPKMKSVHSLNTKIFLGHKSKEKKNAKNFHHTLENAIYRRVSPYISVFISFI